MTNLALGLYCNFVVAVGGGVDGVVVAVDVASAVVAVAGLIAADLTAAAVAAGFASCASCI